MVQLLESLHLREKSFLDQQDWRSITAHFSNATSPWQVLITTVLDLPHLLETYDIAIRDSQGQATENVLAVWANLHDMIRGLIHWEQDFTTSQGGPTYWPVMREQGQSQTGDTDLFPVIFCFPRIIQANTYCHYWAFLLVAISHVLELEKVFPSLRIDGRRKSLLSSDDMDRLGLQLSFNICQSMEFHLRPEMKLFGPPSFIFPLKSAHGFFERKGPRWQQRCRWCKRAASRLVINGVGMAEMYDGE